MSLDFNADEVLEMAEQIERNGSAFYRRAADLAADKQAKSMFLELSAMEDDHEQVFSTMRAGLTQEERKLTVFDPEGELPLYLKAMADRQVFDVSASPAASLTGESTVPDVLRTAISLEKDSIVFYTGLLEMVPPRIGRAKVEHIIKEEMGHIATLGGLLQCLPE